MKNVGWVEHSETHHGHRWQVPPQSFVGGIHFAYPTLQISPNGILTRYSTTIRNTVQACYLGCLVSIVVVLTMALLTGCTAGQSTSPPHNSAPSRNDHPALSRPVIEGYSLLYELVSNESGVDGIFIIKTASPKTVELIRTIADVSRQAVKKLHSFTEIDSRLVLDQTGLPQVESATRAAIESKISRQLLFAGDDFELRLLLTQLEATHYGAALANQLAQIDDNERRSQWLVEFAKQYNDLYEKLLTQLQHETTSQ